MDKQDDCHVSLVLKYESNIQTAKANLKRLWEGHSIPEHSEMVESLVKYIHQIDDNESKLETLKKHFGE